jgi:hypothetical protein
MTLANKIAALLTAIRRQDVEVLSPAERQRLASLCRYVAALAESLPPPVKSDTVYDFSVGRKPE